MRGLDYYNGTCFELKIGDLTDEINPKMAKISTEVLGSSQNTLLAGGRYDYLANQFGYSKGESLPAVGWAMGLSRVMMVTQYMEECKLLRIAERKPLVIGLISFVSKSET